MKIKNKGLSRDEAAELYRDLQKTMRQMQGGSVELESGSPAGSGSKQEIARQIAEAIKKGMAEDDKNMKTDSSTFKGRVRRTSSEKKVVEAPSVASSLPPSTGQREYLLQTLNRQSGVRAAIAFVMFFAICKFVVSGLEASGVFKVEQAYASLGGASLAHPVSGEVYSKEEVKLLTALDARRQELQQRAEKLQLQEGDLEQREREFAIRLTELRDLTQRLSVERERNERRRDSQLEQLANVYGSMNPKEAALLIEQLDITIAIGLLERMPEKRIGQILSLMSPDRALTMTKMLSGRR